MILSYSIISSVLLLFGYLAYRATMSGQCQHSLNRQGLLTVYGVSLTAPLIILAVMLYQPVQSKGVDFEIGDLTGFTPIETVVRSEPSVSTATIVAMAVKVYAAGAVACAAFFIFGFLMLLHKIRKGERTEYGTFSLIIVDDSCKTSPFSCGRYIVMRRSDYDDDGDLILLHEHAHLRHYHWVDLIVAYASICLQWYNPAAWAMREELKAVHEYQADECVLKTGTDAREYQMMLLKKAAGYGYQSLANSLNHSKLKKRVTMMYKRKTSVRRRLFALALIPAIGAGIAVTAIPSVAGVLESIAESSDSSHTETPAPISQKPASDKNVYTAVEEMADFPGGMKAMTEWLYKQINYPEKALKEGVQGRVIVRFIVEPDGSVSDTQVLKGVSKELDKEAVRLVKSMPKWTPGKVNGKPVASYFTIPVNFTLKEDKKENSIPTASKPSEPFQSATQTVSSDEAIFVAVEDQAEFPGGMKALMGWLNDNIRYPEKAVNEDLQGRVIIKFVIKPDGSVSDPQVVRGVSTELNNEAIRLVNAMPRWSPGKVNGQAVASYFTIPINFRLKDDNNNKEEGAR